MAEKKNSQIWVLVGFLSAIAVFIVSLLALSITGQVAYFVHAVTDDAVWTDEYKYENGVNDTDGNKSIYTLAMEQRTADLEYMEKVFTAVSLVISLVSLVIAVALFFGNGGVLSMLKGIKSGN